MAYTFILKINTRYFVRTAPIKHTLDDILRDICLAYRWKIVDLTIYDDHVRISLKMDNSISPKNVAKILKMTSALQVFSVHKEFRGRKKWWVGLWDKSAYYSTIGQINEDDITKYLEG